MDPKKLQKFHKFFNNFRKRWNFNKFLSPAQNSWKYLKFLPTQQIWQKVSQVFLTAQNWQKFYKFLSPAQIEKIFTSFCPSGKIKRQKFFDLKKCTARFVTGGDVPTRNKTLCTICHGWGRPYPWQNVMHDLSRGDVPPVTIRAF